MAARGEARMTMVGADVEQLLQAARHLEAAADQLDAESASLHGILRAVSWLGSIATRFLSRFEGEQQPRMASSASFIRDAAAGLVRQANEQTRASQSNGSSFAGQFRSGRSGTGPTFGHPLGKQGPFHADIEGGISGLLHDGGQIETLTGLIKNFSSIKKLEGFKGLFNVGKEAPGPFAILGTGWDVGQMYARALRGDVDGTVRKGTDVVFDGAGIVYPPIGLAKASWDTGFAVGSFSSHWMDTHFRISDTFIDGVVAHRYGGPHELTPSQAQDLTHRYDGMSGFGHYTTDGISHMKDTVLSWF
jgi:hypothetical protein